MDGLTKKAGTGATIKKRAKERWMILIMRTGADVQMDLTARRTVSRNA